MNGYLFEMGWFNSFKLKEPLDKNLKPIPWVTYSFIDFIIERLKSDFIICEFGSGNSTLFYAEKVKKIYAVEDNYVWYQRIKEKLPENAEIIYENSKGKNEYALAPVKINSKFHIIIIDGTDRVNCIKASINCLNEFGVIILDDSERVEYDEGISFLLAEGFKKLDFWGVSPGTFFRKNTTVFYKANNCLGI
jgi:hypothetical protein